MKELDCLHVDSNIGILATHPFSEKEKQLLQYICSYSEKYAEVKRVYLFGSRALRTHQKSSDFDVAIDAPEMSLAQWSIFADDLKEQFPSLCELDLIFISSEISQDLHQEIFSKGRLFYER